MTKIQHRLVCVLLALGLLASAPSIASAAFSQLSNAFLSVDLNGGNATDAKTNLGWDGAVNQPVAPGSVIWTPWGGAANQGGDGVQLPNQDVPVTATSISKAFGAVTATLSVTGTPSNYGAFSLRSRDRGDLSAQDHGNAGTNNQFGRNLYRDFVHTITSGSNIAGTNFIQIDFTGLAPNSSYQVAFFSYDRSGAHTMHYTATAPAANNAGSIGWWDDPSASNFLQPADVQAITWVGAASITGLPAPALFTKSADGTGKLTFYAYGRGGDGTPAQNNFADTTYINGFQIAAVPEPAGALLAAIGLFTVALRRKR
jgi:hypothetical protein